MSAYRDCQSVNNNFGNIKMDSRDDTADTACLSPSTASPPDFDFNLPCRFFKSTFARSLSLNNSSYSSSNQCKSLDYDMRSNNSNNNKLSCLKRDTTAVLTVQPLPQRRLSQAGSFYQQNEVNKCERKQVFDDADIANDREKPPALPARRPLSLHNMTLPQNLSQMNAEQKFQQTMLTQLRQQAYKQSTNNSNGNNNKNNLNNCIDHATGLQLLSQQPTLSKNPHSYHLTATTNPNVSSSNNINNNNNNNCNNNSINNNQNNLRRNSNDNHIVWLNQQKNVEQNCNICIFDQVENENVGNDLNSNYHDATKLSTVNDYNNHFHNSHQMLQMIPTININSNSQQLGNNQQHCQQQQQEISSYDILNDNSTNVEAVILQNQVDTLQWQLKQVETSCDMYRAVMEEVARFLERYQSQKQQLQQQQQQMAAQKHYNNSSNSKMEQIPRSKSLFQVYIGGGHEKNGNNVVDERTTTTLSPATSNSTSYLRARSSTNLIDLKHQQSNASCNSKSKDDYNFETGLTPSQSYSAFKDFTWRRSPKKPDSRSNIAKDDNEEKLNQEAFRLLRTIQNLLNTSQHQPDLAQHRHSLAPVTALKMTNLSKAMSTTSVMTLPGPPVLNSTSLNTCSNSDGSTKSDDTSSTASPTITTSVNNAVSNNLAPEVLFLRSTNMRDSRLSLRSSTDSSVHSTSSAASSASSKVDTDEEPSTLFLTASNMLPRKQQQQQHQHLAGSSTEDESGFSSISSFPDIGISLSSTMLSNAPNSSNKTRSIGKEVKALKANERDLQTSDSRNSTLKANVVGLPLNTSQDMSHRWDSPSKTYHNASNKFQRFSALTNEDSNAVLWV